MDSDGSYRNHVLDGVQMSHARGNFEARAAHLLKKKYSPTDVSIILLTNENIFTVTTPKNTECHLCRVAGNTV